MPKWYVELYAGPEILHLGKPFTRENQEVLSFLTTCLQDPSFTIIEMEGYHFWLSSDFEALASEEEVYQYAKNQLPILNGIMELKFGRDTCTIKIGDVYHPDNNGNLVRTVQRTTLVVESYPNENFLRAANAQQPGTIDILLMARNNSLIEEALQYYSLPHNWHNLEKIFEIIAKDVRKSEHNGKLSKGTFSNWARGWANDFLQTAHSYHWSGLGARHSSVESEKRSRVTPMHLDKAIESISDLFMKWLWTNP